MSCLVAKDWDNFKFLGHLLCFCGREARPFSSIKPSTTNHVNSRIVDEKIMFDVCMSVEKLMLILIILIYITLCFDIILMSMLTFLTFTYEFCLWEFSACSSVHSDSQKSVYCCLVITLWKCGYCLIWALNKSILFGCNSPKVLVLCNMNIEKTFYYSLIWKELYQNVSIAWHKLWKSE